MTVFSYLRLSHEEQFNNGISLDTQKDRCSKYAILQEMKIDKSYQELCSGGIEFRKRKVFSKILSQLKSGDVLVCSRLDRLSRNTLDLLKLVEHLKKIKVGLHFVDIGLVSGEGIGRIFLIMLSAFAENERLMVSERIKQNKKRYKEENKYLGGYVEFGKQKTNKGIYNQNDKEQEIIDSIVNLKKNGITYRKIADVIKNKFGRNLHYSFVYKLYQRHTATIVANSI